MHKNFNILDLILDTLIFDIYIIKTKIIGCDCIQNYKKQMTVVLTNFYHLHDFISLMETMSENETAIWIIPSITEFNYLHQCMGIEPSCTC